MPEHPKISPGQMQPAHTTLHGPRALIERNCLRRSRRANFALGRTGQRQDCAVQYPGGPPLLIDWIDLRHNGQQ